MTSDECHAWFCLNAASPAERNTEQVNITKILSTIGFEKKGYMYMHAMVDFICIGLVEVRGKRSKRELQNENSFTRGFKHTCKHNDIHIPKNPV